MENTASTIQQNGAGLPSQQNILPPPPISQIDCSLLNTIEPYAGGQDADIFFETVKALAKNYRWTNEQHFTAILFRIQGEVKRTYYRLDASQRPANLADFKSWVFDIFARPPNKHVSMKSFNQEVRRSGESLRAFHTRLQTLATTIWPVNADITSSHYLVQRVTQQCKIFEQFKRGLTSRLLNEVMRTGEYLTMDEFLPVAEQCEAVFDRMITEQTLGDMEMLSIRNINTNRHQNIPQNRRTVSSSVVDLLNQYPEMVDKCFKCGQPGHLARGCRTRTRFCFKCKKQGHMHLQCKAENANARPL